MNQSRKDNQVTVIGEIVSTFTYDHQYYGEKFYTLTLSVERQSGTKDLLPVIISEHLLETAQDLRGEYVEIKGEYRSFNQVDKTPKMKLYIFAQEAELMAGDVIYTSSDNEIILHGTVCKEPVYRKTPLGRDITDLLLAVKRPFKHSDYIPCIVWGRIAKMAGRLQVGDHITLIGRIQSRTYKKIFDDGSVEERTCYEVSAYMCRKEENES